jgi:PIN domain nuclease of toxin-antitoxin system
MKYLLDTHTLLWFLADALELSATAKHVIENEVEDTYVNIGSLWEIAIKVSGGKLELESSIV